MICLCDSRRPGQRRHPGRAHEGCGLGAVAGSSAPTAGCGGVRLRRRAAAPGGEGEDQGAERILQEEDKCLELELEVRRSPGRGPRRCPCAGAERSERVWRSYSSNFLHGRKLLLGRCRQLLGQHICWQWHGSSTPPRISACRRGHCPVQPSLLYATSAGQWSGSFAPRLLVLASVCLCESSVRPQPHAALAKLCLLVVACAGQWLWLLCTCVVLACA